MRTTPAPSDPAEPLVVAQVIERILTLPGSAGASPMRSSAHGQPLQATALSWARLRISAHRGQRFRLIVDGISA
jgi:hypothetical protein